ncbi:MAG: Gfo/Idh/MocA family oxidoreductase [Planctomycetales bacterium]|nr:Gfo/Idh/MocA family oxidoreductase [Planctomycetales bacterium]
MKTFSNQTDRRQFLSRSAMTLGALAAASRVHADGAGGETLRVGLIGCGGRGEGAAIDALMADPQTELVAVGDAFRDRADDCLGRLQQNEQVSSRVNVSPERVFDDFDNFKHVIDSGVDVVLLTTPPHFRPQHLDYAVQQGKHVFVEKPVAVDVPGAKRVAATCRVAADKGLSIVSGLCWRYDLGVRETMARIADGAIGDIIAIESTYNTNQLWHRGDDPSWSRMEYQLRNWLYYTWLSGDHIAEQAIHSLDKTAWLNGDASPVSAVGLGGRQQRTDPKYGHIFDHHTVFYKYDGGAPVYFTCRQQDNTATNVDELVLGTKGTAQVLRNQIDGETKWRYRGPKPSMYRREHEEFFQSIRSGAPINNGDYMVNSTLIATMGRMATYTGQEVTWDQVQASGEQLGPATYAWGDLPEPPVAIPGVTKLGTELAQTTT